MPTNVTCACGGYAWRLVLRTKVSIEYQRFCTSCGKKGTNVKEVDMETVRGGEHKQGYARSRSKAHGYAEAGTSFARHAAANVYDYGVRKRRRLAARNFMDAANHLKAINQNAEAAALAVAAFIMEVSS